MPRTLLLARRTAILPACLLAACCAVPAAAEEAASARRTVAWSLVQAGRGERSLEVSFAYGGCERDPVAKATEHPRGIAVTVTIEDRREPGVACPAYVRLATATVRLAHPLAGRKLLGTWSVRSPLPAGARTVPRAVGLSPGDARRLLETVGHPRIDVHHGHRGLPRVVAQSPAAGTRVREAPVTLQVYAP